MAKQAEDDADRAAQSARRDAAARGPLRRGARSRDEVQGRGSGDSRARAAERYDAKKARAHFQRAIAASRPQERLQLRRMADASMALAERRAGDLKKATERLGVETPPNRQLDGLKFNGAWSPARQRRDARPDRGNRAGDLLIVAILLLGFGIVNLISLPFGGISLDLGIFYGSSWCSWRSRARLLRTAPATPSPGERAEQIAAALALRPASDVRRYTLATPDPGAIRDRFPHRRGHRVPPALQCRSRRRRSRG